MPGPAGQSPDYRGVKIVTGAGCSAAAACLDNITGFSGTGFLKCTGADAYAFVADSLPVASGGTEAATASAGLGAAAATTTGDNTTKVSTIDYVQKAITDGGNAASFTTINASGLISRRRRPVSRRRRPMTTPMPAVRATTKKSARPERRSAQCVKHFACCWRIRVWRSHCARQVLGPRRGVHGRIRQLHDVDLPGQRFHPGTASALIIASRMPRIAAPV